MWCGMGSWYESCCISNLPIVGNTEARLVILTQNNGWEGRTTSGGFCYATDIWSPRALPIKGNYSDSGTITNIANDLNLELLQRSFELGGVVPDDCDNIEEVPKELVKLFRLIERGRIQDKDDYAHRQVMIGQVMIREDIFQSILKYPLNHPWINLDLAFQKEEARKFIKECIEKGIKYKTKDPSFGLKEALRWKDDLKLKNDFLKNSDNGEHLPHCISKYNTWIEGICTEQDLSEDRVADMEKLLDGCIELIHVNRYMQSIRRHWGPQCGKGSQDCDLEPYVYLAKEILNVADKSKQDEKDHSSK